MERFNKEFKGYEYKVIDVKNSLVKIYNDYLPNFGWEVEFETTPNPNKAKLNIKRDRFLDNKNELQRLQRIFEYKAFTIDQLEKQKSRKASIFSLSLGTLGTVFMTLSVFSYLAANYYLTTLFAIPAFTGWFTSYFIYKKILHIKTDELNPRIEELYNEIYFTGKKAFSLLKSE